MTARPASVPDDDGVSSGAAASLPHGPVPAPAVVAVPHHTPFQARRGPAQAPVYAERRGRPAGRGLLVRLHHFLAPHRP
jgi:hypothetical protein